MELIATKIPGIYLYKGKKGEDVFYASFRHPINGKPIRKKLGTKGKDLKNEKEALIKLEQLKEQLKDYNTNQIQEEQDDYKNYLTLNQLADLYFEDRYNKIKRIMKEDYKIFKEDELLQNPNVKKKIQNAKGEEIRYNKNVKNFNIAKMNLNTIKYKDVENFKNIDLMTLNISIKTKFNIVSLIKTIVNFGIKKRIINIQNPFQHLHYKNPQRQRERVLSIEEIELLLKEARKETDKNIYMILYLGVLTGGRSNTILNIRKKDIDFKNEIVYLYNFKASRQYKMQLPTKAIKWLEKTLKEWDDDEFVIKAHKKQYIQELKKPFRQLPKPLYSLMDRLFNTQLNKQDNFDRDKVVNFHTIRRSIATNLAMKGTPLYEVMIFLNHSNIDQTMKYLSIAHNNLNQSHSNLMGNIFANF